MDYKKAAKDARDHSDSARESSDAHLCELTQMRESALQAANDTEARRQYRKDREDFKQSQLKSG